MERHIELGGRNLFSNSGSGGTQAEVAISKPQPDWPPLTSKLGQIPRATSHLPELTHVEEEQLLRGLMDHFGAHMLPAMQSGTKGFQTDAGPPNSYTRRVGRSPDTLPRGAELVA